MLASARAIVCALTTLLTITPADAQTVAQTIERWGLAGTWSLDCSQPASRQNYYLSYVATADGRASHDRDFGDGKDSHAIQRATILPDGMIELTVHFKSFGETRKWRLVKSPDRRIKTMVNSNVDGGDFTIKDGKFVPSGAEVRWQTRCR